MRINYLSRTTLILSGLVVFLILIVIFGWQFRKLEVQNPQPPANLSLQQDVDSFYQNYWQTPIPLQGKPPAGFTKEEASLSPQACGSCHPEQYRDWKESLHSKAMGPGPWGQIIDSTQTNPQEAILCLTCHAPLSEQMPFLTGTASNGGQSYTNNSQFDSKLQLQGIVCASCHVRQHQRFGPPKQEGEAKQPYPSSMPNHGGVQRTPHFDRAEFCRGCHQFDPENSLLVNGKPLQDTYREWKNSIWGKGGASCQQCHMPNRRHLWKGIHDPEMVKGGVRVEAGLKAASESPAGIIEIEVKLTNAAVGHKFPTYTTPKVFVRAELHTKAGNVLPGTQKEATIGWDARAEGGQWKEFFDTRIPPGESSKHLFKWNRTVEAETVRAWVEVHPDYFYHVHFYPAYLSSGALSPEGRRLIEKARQESGGSSFILFDKNIPLN